MKKGIAFLCALVLIMIIGSVRAESRKSLEDLIVEYNDILEIVQRYTAEVQACDDYIAAAEAADKDALNEAKLQLGRLGIDLSKIRGSVKTNVEATRNLSAFMLDWYQEDLQTNLKLQEVYYVEALAIEQKAKGAIAILENGLRLCPVGSTSKYLVGAEFELPDTLFTSAPIDNGLMGTVYLVTGTILEKHDDREFLVNVDDRSIYILIPSRLEEDVDFTMPRVGEDANFYLTYFTRGNAGLPVFILGADEWYVDSLQK